MGYRQGLIRTLLIIIIGVLSFISISPTLQFKNLVLASFYPKNQALATAPVIISTQSAHLKMTPLVPAVSVTVTPSSVASSSAVTALTISSTGDNCFTLYGYPTSYGPGINWTVSSGGIFPGQDVVVGVQVNSNVPLGTYTGTGILDNCNSNSPKITFPVTVIVTQPQPSSL